MEPKRDAMIFSSPTIPVLIVTALLLLTAGCALPGTYRSTGSLRPEADVRKYQWVVVHPKSVEQHFVADTLRAKGFRVLRSERYSAVMSPEIDKRDVLQASCTYLGHRPKGGGSTTAEVSCEVVELGTSATIYEGNGEYMAAASRTEDIRGAIRAALAGLPSTGRVGSITDTLPPSSLSMNARERLDNFLRTTPTPLPCDRGYIHRRGYVVNLADWAERAGLRRGDFIKSLNGRPLEVGEADPLREATPGEPIALLVVRHGQEVSLRLPCKDSAAHWAAWKRMFEAAARADWGNCIAATFDIQRSSGIASAGMMWWRGRCDWARNRVQGRPVDVSEARLLYEAHRVLLAEAVHEPGGVDRARAQILTAIGGLREYGFANLALDLDDVFRRASKTQAVGRASPEAGGQPQRSQGTGFLVRPDGILLTAFHVIAAAKTVTVTRPGHASTSGIVAQSSAATDVAVVKTPLSGAVYLELADASSAKLGDPVFTLGFPATGILGREVKFADGAVSALSGPDGDASMLQVTVPVQPGNSGGPLVNSKGQVIGIFTASASVLPFLRETGTLPQNINWAVKSEYARPLFTPPSTSMAATLKEEAIERAKKATCLIEASP